MFMMMWELNAYLYYSYGNNQSRLSLFPDNKRIFAVSRFIRNLDQGRIQVSETPPCRDLPVLERFELNMDRCPNREIPWQLVPVP